MEIFNKGLIYTYPPSEELFTPMLIALIVLTAIIGYLLGSLNFGVIISKVFYKDDVRTHGSGNAGTTNMLRTYGKQAALGTLVGDALKAAVAILIGWLLLGKGLDDYNSFINGGYIGGFFAILGHVYPIYYKFKGGKGVITSAITMLMLNPSVFAVVFTFFVVIVAIWRYISLGSILSAALYPMVVYVFEGPGLGFVFALLIGIFVIFLHRTNIQRLFDGKENKLSFKKAGSITKDKKEDNK